MFSTLLHKFLSATARRQKRGQRKSARSVRLSLERLEDRTVLSGLSGDFGAGGIAAINSLVASKENALNALVASWEKDVNALAASRKDAANPCIVALEKGINALVAAEEKDINPLAASWEKEMNALIASWEKDMNALDKKLGLPPLFPGADKHDHGKHKAPSLSVQITGLPTSLSDPEGTTISLGSQVTGPPHDSYQYQWTVTENGNTIASGNKSSFSFTLGPPGNYTVSLTVTDNQHKTATATATIASTAVLSVQITGLPASLTDPEGTTINLGSQVTGPPQDSYQYQWTVTENGNTIASGNESSFSFTLGTPGNYTVSLTVTDNQNKTATASATITSTAAGVPDEPLLYSSNLQLIGAFRLPSSMAGGSGTPGFGFANGVLGYDPTRNGLFVTGFQQGVGDESVGEVSIPSTIVNSSNLNDLTTATELQPLVDFIPNMPNPMPSDVSNNGQYIGGMLVYNGQLVGTDYAYYTGSFQPASDFTLSSLNLSTASVQGLYSVGSVGRLAAGWLIPVPSEWQAVLGYPVLTGQGDTNNIASVSSGPALLGLNPSDLSYPSPAPTTTFLDYPASNPLGPYDGAVDPLQNGTTEIGGGVFVPGTSTVLFFGVTGTNYDSYGPPGQEGPWSLNGQYALQVWAYNAKDLVAAKQGLLQPSQVQPYDVWNFQLPIESNYYFDGTHRSWVGGVAFDPSTNRIYLSIAGADTGNPNEPMPLIYAFQVNVPSGPTSAPPQVGTLAATPTDLSSLTLTADGGDATTGPLPAGTALTLTAGNVYAITPGASITQVAFYLGTGNGGTLSSSDQLLGDGTPSTIPNAQHNYTLTMSTAGLTSGTYTLFAQATDSNGQVSNVVETTITIA